MSDSYEEAFVPGYRENGLVEIEDFAVQRAHSGSDNLNDTPNEQNPSQSAMNVDGVQEAEVGEKALEVSNNSCRNSPFESKKNFKRRRDWAVKSVSEWIFPPGTRNKHSFVVSSLRLGIDPKVAFQREEKKSPNDRYNTRANRRRRINERNNIGKRMVRPIVAGVKFDNRFLRYEQSPDGETNEENLVRLLSLRTIPIKNCSLVIEAWEKHYIIEQISDEPNRSKTSSRIGPKYQAQIPPKLKGAYTETVDDLFPGYHRMWDPKLATEAEQRGEDISGFLEGNYDLCTQDLLHSILHDNDYSVRAARTELEKMQRQKNLGSLSKLNDDEAKQFERLIHYGQKDISKVAKSLKRKPSDCLVHYYMWKATSPSYRSLKKMWKSQYCSVCRDGGFLIICDGCSSTFHMECVEPPLTAVPEGSWFCDCCRNAKRTASPIYTGKKLFHVKKQSSSNGTSVAESISSEE